MEQPVVAKKKAKADPGRRPVAIMVKGNEAWKRWVDEGARHCQLSVSSAVTLALTRFYKEYGFTKKPPER